MGNEQKALEVKVGIFVFIGLAIIAGMALQFGRLGQGLNKYYSITVSFPNASGLLKNSDVQLSGAVVGHVSKKPDIDPQHIGSVSVALDIGEHYHLPKNCRFTIGSSGLLGDKYVDIALPDGFDAQKFNPKDSAEVIQPGESIEGSPTGGIDALTRKGEIVMDSLKSTVDEVKGAVVDIRGAVNTVKTTVLSQNTLQNIETAFSNIKTTSDHFASASKNFDVIVLDAHGAVENAKQAMSTANAAVTDIRGAVEDARGVIGTAQTLLKTAESGRGAIPMLLSNKQVAEDLSALISNIRRHGVLFYRDSQQPPATQSPLRVNTKMR